MSTRFALILGMLGLHLSVVAQVTFQAEVSQSVLPKGDRLRLTYVLDGAQGQDLRLPDLPGFKVLSGPNVSSSYTIVNGATSASQRYSFDLRAEKEGLLTLGAATVLVNGQRLRSKAIKVRVEPARAAPATGDLSKDEPVMVRLALEKDTVFIGEKVDVSIEVLSQRQIYSYSELNPLDFSGLRADKVPRFDPSQRTVEIEGKPFLSRRLAQYAVYPNKPGAIALGPTELRLLILKPGARRSFFFDPPTQAFNVKSDIRKLVVMGLPTPTAPHFSGLIGRWQFQAGVDKIKDITTADALTYKLFVQGQGDITRLVPPELKWPTGWRSYPPETSLSQSVETDTGIVHTRVFEYTIAPTKGGISSFSPKLSYFDTELKRYVTWTAPLQRVKVKDVGGALPLEPEAAGTAFEPYVGREQVVGPSWFDASWYYGALAAGPVLALLAFIGVRLKDRSEGRGKLSPKQDPIAEGKRRLAAARAALASPNEFYQEVRQALEQYATDRLGLATSQQSATAIRAGFAEKASNDESNLADRFLAARDLADRGLYGGGTDEAGRREALEELERLLSE